MSSSKTSAIDVFSELLHTLSGIPNAFIAARDDDVDDVVSLAFNRTFKVMENLGATIIEHADFPDLEAYLPNRAGVSDLSS